MPQSVGTIINGRRTSSGGSSALTFSSPDGTISITQVGDDVELELAGGPIEITSVDGSVDVMQVGNSFDLEVVSTPQLLELDGQTTDASTPLVFVLGTLANDGDSLDVNLNVSGTSDDGADLRHQTIVGFNAVRTGGSIVTAPAMFVNSAAQAGGGGGCALDPFDVSGNDVRLTILGLAGTTITWAVRGSTTFTPG